VSVAAAPGASISGWTGAVIDADVHAVVPSVEALRPYLGPHWNEYVDETGFTEPPWMASVYPPGAAITVDPRWRDPDAAPAGTTLEGLRRTVLDPLGVDAAILNCYWGVERLRHPDFSAAIARAINDWLIAEWLDRDERLRASLVVPAFVPAEAAAEVDRVGGHPGFVQVFLPVRTTRPYGNRTWHPLFEALVRNDLVAGVHYGGTADAAGPTGLESWFLEEYVAGLPSAFQAQLTSMVSEGLFQKFPELRVSFLESGFSWVGPTLWRMDREWPSLRRDVPWLTEEPSKIVGRHVKFSGQPIDAGPAADFANSLGWFDAADMLMFASDYPHGHELDVGHLLAALPAADHAKVMAENARSHYRL